MSPELFADLAADRSRLAFASRSRDRMIERLVHVDPESAAEGR